MSISIRLAAVEDIPALQELITASVRVLSAPYYDFGQIESALIHVFSVDSRLIQDETYFVAESEGQIVGCGGWSKRLSLFRGDQAKSDQVDDLLQPVKDAARLRAFYVHPEWSRRGIGRQIVTTCEIGAKEAVLAKQDATRSCLSLSKHMEKPRALRQAQGERNNVLRANGNNVNKTKGEPHSASRRARGKGGRNGRAGARGKGAALAVPGWAGGMAHG